MRRPPCSALILLLGLVPGAQGQPFFEDVSDQAGITATHNAFIFGTGQAWLDVDRDGDLDLFVSNREGPNHLYINQNNGQFIESAQFDSLAVPADRSTGVVVADYDNDGWLDIYVNCDGPNRLFRNLGGQGFEDVAQLAGVANPHNSQVATWADLNQDGWLDLYVGNYRIATDATDAGGNPAVPDALYLNQGNGTFLDMADQLDSVQTHKPALAVTFVDIDRDGDQDLYVINDRLAGNTLWRNDGPPVAGCGPHWCLTDISLPTGTDRPVFGMGIAIADYDHDGDDDLYFSSLGEQVLLQNQSESGSLVFVDVSTSAGLDFDSSGWATLFIDVDNDSWDDAYLATYGTMIEHADQFYLNQRDGTFVPVSETSGIQSLTRSEGAAMGDFDNDGMMDVIVSDMGSRYRLYRNISPSDAHWVSIELTGRPPINADAIGAVVELTTDQGQNHRRELISGGSRGAGNQLRLHFGLGQQNIASARIIWPDGFEQDIELTLDQINYLSYPDRITLFVDGFE